MRIKKNENAPCAGKFFAQAGHDPEDPPHDWTRQVPNRQELPSLDWGHSTRRCRNCGVYWHQSWLGPMGGGFMKFWYEPGKIIYSFDFI